MKYIRPKVSERRKSVEGGAQRVGLDAQQAKGIKDNWPEPDQVRQLDLKAGKCLSFEDCPNGDSKTSSGFNILW
jgi:beta-phosphoglucomutase-like phosphatase (HAD superfamily)